MTMFIVLTYLFQINKSRYFVRTHIILMCVMLSITTFYIRKSNGTIRKITNVKDGYAQVSVIVMKNNKASNLINLKRHRLGYSVTGQTVYTYKSLSDLQKELHDDITLIKYKSMETFSDELFSGQVDALLLDEGSRAIMEDAHPEFSIKTKVIKTFEYKIAYKALSENGKSNH